MSDDEEKSEFEKTSEELVTISERLDGEEGVQAMTLSGTFGTTFFHAPDAPTYAKMQSDFMWALHEALQEQMLFPSYYGERGEEADAEAVLHDLEENIRRSDDVLLDALSRLATEYDIDYDPYGPSMLDGVGDI